MGSEMCIRDRSEGVRLSGAEAVEISFPGFFDLLSTVAVTGDIGAH